MIKVCHCGFGEDNHYFRHDYENKVKIKKDSIERYTINAHDYPISKGVKCGFQDCKAEAFGHSPIHIDMTLSQDEREKLREKYRYLIEHVYSPVEYEYRNINFVLPQDSICNHIEYDKEGNFVRCSLSLENHRKVLTHHFTTYIHIDNLNEKDKVNIQDEEDEDRKIIWKRV